MSKTKKPIYRRRWFIVLASTFALIVLLQSCGSDPGVAETPAPTAEETTASAEPTEEAPPMETEEPAPAIDLATMVADEIALNSPGGLPTWALPITGLENVNSTTIRVFYQEPNMTKDEAKEVARLIYTFTSNNETIWSTLDTIVIQDATGRDINAYKDKVLR